MNMQVDNSSQVIYCSSCGTKNLKTSTHCKSCQAPLLPPASSQSYQNNPEAIVVVQQTGQPTKDKGTALILEILPGLFGFLGFGWIYAGNTSTGILCLIGFFLWSVFAGILSAITAGIGIICWFPISVTGIVLSAVQLNSYAKKHPETFR